MSALSKLFWIPASLAFFTYCAFFAISNEASLTLYYWPSTAPLMLPVWLAMLGGFSAGLLVMAIVSSVLTSALRMRLFGLQKKLDKLQAAQQQKSMSDNETLEHKS